MRPSAIIAWAPLQSLKQRTTSRNSKSLERLGEDAADADHRQVGIGFILRWAPIGRVAR